MQEKEIHAQLAIIHDRLASHNPGGKIYDALMVEYKKLHRELQKLQGSKKYSEKEAITEALNRDDANKVFGVDWPKIRHWRYSYNTGSMKKSIVNKLLTTAGYAVVVEEMWGRK